MADILSNLIGHWKLDDNAESTTVVATVGPNGTLTGAGNTSGSSVAGPGGSLANGMTFDGSDDFVNFGNQAAFAFNSGHTFSIAAWVRPGDDTGNIFSNRFGAVPRGYALVWLGGTDQIVLTNSETISGFESDTVFTDNGNWVHVAVVYSGGVANYYRNGVSAGQSSSTYNFITAANQGVRINGSVFNSAWNFWLDGDIADVRVYTRALDSEDVLALYALGVSQMPAIANHYRRLRG